MMEREGEEVTSHGGQNFPNWKKNKNSKFNVRRSQLGPDIPHEMLKIIVVEKRENI